MHAHREAALIEGTLDDFNSFLRHDAVAALRQHSLRRKGDSTLPLLDHKLLLLLEIGTHFAPLFLLKHVLVGERDFEGRIVAHLEFFLAVAQEHLEEGSEVGTLLAELGERVARLLRILLLTRVAIKQRPVRTPAPTAGKLKI